MGLYFQSNSSLTFQDKKKEEEEESRFLLHKALDQIKWTVKMNQNMALAQ